MRQDDGGNTATRWLGRRWFGRRRRGFLGDRRGAAAVEFAFVVGPFIALIAAIFQTALLCLSDQVLDTAVNEAARLIRTGQAKSYTVTDFQNAVCANVYGLLDCTSLSVNVNSYTTFASVPTPTDPIDASNNLDTSAFTFAPGVGSSVVVVQVYYPFSLFLYSFLATWKLDLADLANGKRLLSSTAVFQNEPFP